MVMFPSGRHQPALYLAGGREAIDVIHEAGDEGRRRAVLDLLGSADLLDVTPAETSVARSRHCQSHLCKVPQ